MEHQHNPNQEQLGPQHIPEGSRNVSSESFPAVHSDMFEYGSNHDNVYQTNPYGLVVQIPSTRTMGNMSHHTPLHAPLDPAQSHSHSPASAGPRSATHHTYRNAYFQSGTSHHGAHPLPTPNGIDPSAQDHSFPFPASHHFPLPAAHQHASPLPHHHHPQQEFYHTSSSPEPTSPNPNRTHSPSPTLEDRSRSNSVNAPRTRSEERDLARGLSPGAARRKAQNRRAQRNFRNRRIQEKADLVAENKKLQSKVDKLQAENDRLRAMFHRYANNEDVGSGRIPHLMSLSVSDSDNSDDDNDHEAADPTRGRGRTPRILVKPEPDIEMDNVSSSDFGSKEKAPPGSLNKKQAMEAVSSHPLVAMRQVQLDEVEAMVLDMGSRGSDGGFVISEELVTQIVLDAARVASDALG